MVPAQQADRAAEQPARRTAPEPVPSPERRVVDEDREVDELDGRGHFGGIVAPLRRARGARAEEHQQGTNARNARREKAIGVEARRRTFAPREVAHRLIEVLQPQPEVFEKQLGVEERASKDRRTDGCHAATLTHDRSFPTRLHRIS